MDDERRAELGDNIRRARKARGWRQNDLAQVAAVAVTLVGRAERGKKVSTTTLRAIAMALPEAALSVPDEPAGPDLRDDIERQLWGLRGATEEDRWALIDLHRARESRRSELRQGHSA